MIRESPDDSATLGPEAARHLDGICTRFERAWKRGDRPRIEDFLEGAADSERPALLAELILLELVYRRAIGEDCGAAEYTGRFPGLDPAWLDRAIAAPSAGATDPVARRRPANMWPEGADPSGAADVQARSFGDYRILRSIGEGGMGVVYEAIRESLHNRVALKVIHPRFRASAGYLRRFQTEARSAAQLHHTNIVSVFDYGQHDGVCYYAMQHIDGHSLDEILVEVRRLRSDQGPVKIAPVETGPAANMPGVPASHGAGPGVAGTEAAADPLMRTITQGLMTGQFALGAGVALDPSTEPIAPGVGTRTAGTHDLGFDLRRPQAPSWPPTRDRDRNAGRLRHDG